MKLMPDRIDGRSAWHTALQAAAAHAAAHEREVCLIDPTFEIWPLDDAEWLASLMAFAKQPLRRVRMVACSFDAIPVHHPLFTRWRRDWGHVIECYRTDVESSQVPTLMLAGDHSIHLTAPALWRGQVLREAASRRDWAEVVDALLQRSEPGFAPTTLGL